MSYVCPALLGELRLPATPKDVPRLPMLKSSFARPLLNGSQVHLRDSTFKSMPVGVSGYVTITRDVGPALLFWIYYWQNRIGHKRKWQQEDGPPTLPMELWEKIVWYTGPTSYISANVYGSSPGRPPTTVRDRPSTTKATITSQYWSEVVVRDALLAVYPAISQGSVYIQTVNLRRAVKLVAIPAAAFKDCLHLKQVLLPPSIVYVGASAFRGCESLQGSIVLPRVHFVGEGAFCGTKITVLEMPVLSKIPSSMCCGCESLELVRVPSARSGSTRMFLNCSSLIAVCFHPDAMLDAACASAFHNCSNLEQIAVSVSAVGAYQFSGCYSLKTGIRILPTCVSFPIGCFDNCGVHVAACETVSHFGDNALRRTSIEYVNCHVLCSVGSLAFQGTKLLRTVTLRISNVEDMHTAVGYKAFAGSAVVHVSIELLSPRHQVIGASAFAHCNRLRTVELTARGSVAVSSLAFFGCKALTQVDISTAPCGQDGSAPLRLTGAATFGDCVLLEKVVILEAAVIAWSTFVGCGSLSSLTMHHGTTFTGSTHFPDMSRHLLRWGCPTLRALPSPHSAPIIGLCCLLQVGALTHVDVGILSVGCAQRFITPVVQSPSNEWAFTPIAFKFVAKTRYTVCGTRVYCPPAGAAVVTLRIVADVGDPHEVAFVHCGETKHSTVPSARLTNEDILSIAIELFPSIADGSTAFTCPAVGSGAITSTQLVQYILNAPSRAMKRGHRFTFTFGSVAAAAEVDYRPNVVAQSTLHTCSNHRTESEWVALLVAAFPFMAASTCVLSVPQQDVLHTVALWRAIAAGDCDFRPDLLPGVLLSQARYASALSRWKGGGYYSADQVEGSFSTDRCTF
jgi:hypothetical protein